jgi:hypothetical protein
MRKILYSFYQCNLFCRWTDPVLNHWPFEQREGFGKSTKSYLVAAFVFKRRIRTNFMPMVHGVEGTEVDLRSEAGSEDVARPEAEAVSRAMSMGKEEGVVSITDPEMPQPTPK